MARSWARRSTAAAAATGEVWSFASRRRDRNTKKQFSIALPVAAMDRSRKRRLSRIGEYSWERPATAQTDSHAAVSAERFTSCGQTRVATSIRCFSASTGKPATFHAPALSFANTRFLVQRTLEATNASTPPEPFSGCATSILGGRRGPLSQGCPRWPSNREKHGEIGSPLASAIDRE